MAHRLLANWRNNLVVGGMLTEWWVILYEDYAILEYPYFKDNIIEKGNLVFKEYKIEGELHKRLLNINTNENDREIILEKDLEEIINLVVNIFS